MAVSDNKPANEPSEARPALEVEVVGEAGSVVAKRRRGRPEGAKNKPKPADMTDEEFRAFTTKARREAFVAAHQKLMDSIHKVPATGAAVLWGICHDKSTSADTQPLSLHQTNITIHGNVGRDALLKGLGAKVVNVTQHAKDVARTAIQGPDTPAKEVKP